MTKEDIEKVAVELGNILSPEHYYVGCGYPAIEKAIEVLTTYRAQVLEEEKQRCADIFTDMVLDLRDENGTPVARELKLNAVLQALGHPTN